MGGLAQTFGKARDAFLKIAEKGDPLFKYNSRADFLGQQTGVWGDSDYRQNLGKMDPLGQLTGLYGNRKNAYAYDPIGLKMGMYGYTVTPAANMGAYVYGSQASQQAQPSTPAFSMSATPRPMVGTDSSSTSKLLLGD